jgi:L-threonylcarbamoyladenylate synthase
VTSCPRTTIADVTWIPAKRRRYSGTAANRAGGGKGLKVPINGRGQEIPVRRVNPLFPEEECLAWAAGIVAGGGVVVYPTETFYGLGGHPRLPAAVERIYRIKGRAWDKPLPLIAANRAAVRLVAASWSAVAERLAGDFWPGPLTLVVAAAPWVPAALHAQTGKVAVRVSSHAAAQRLAALVGGLVIATSANRSGDPACRSPEDLPEALLSRTDGVLHGGLTAGGQPSTVIDVTATPARLVRAGAIARQQLEQYL